MTAAAIGKRKLKNASVLKMHRERNQGKNRKLDGHSNYSNAQEIGKKVERLFNIQPFLGASLLGQSTV